jgi:hypothetical protein
MEAHINGISLSSYIDKLNEGKLEGLTFLARDMHVHHEDENIRNDSLENLKLINGIQHNKEHRIQNHNSMRYEVIEDEIISITKAGIHKTFDVKMAYPFHNYIANGIVVHNCGKSQVMRAIGAERGSIAIFAQGSDFLTCWQGEAEKNPKRLFLAAVRLRQESKRHVHLLLDEADSVLKKPEDRKSTDIDLTLEFQILLDGVVNYPGITLWGATNSPGKIPMALIRRFNKVLIVGELSLEDRAKLLEMFCRALPTVDFDSRTWLRLAERLDGATGDVVRKVIDHVWRFCIDGFVASKPEEAKNLVKWLNTCNHDGGGFDISKFKASDFIELGERLRKYTKIIPRDVENSVEAHLKNPAVRAEIETAKATYKEARELLTDLGRSKIQIVAG